MYNIGQVWLPTNFIDKIFNFFSRDTSLTTRKAFCHKNMKVSLTKMSISTRKSIQKAWTTRSWQKLQDKVATPTGLDGSQDTAAENLKKVIDTFYDHTGRCLEDSSVEDGDSTTSRGLDNMRVIPMILLYDSLLLTKTTYRKVRRIRPHLVW